MKKIFICLLFIVGFSSGIAVAGILIIGNKDVPDAELSRKDVKNMFLGKQRQWSDSSKVYPAAVEVPDIQKAFLHQYLNKTVAKYNVYWKRMIFTGKGAPPKSIGTEAELIKYVSETKGAIGYISSESIPAGDESKIIIIKIK